MMSKNSGHTFFRGIVVAALLLATLVFGMQIARAMPQMATVEAGTYDDNDSNITYSGSWSAGSMDGLYNNTYHRSDATGNSAQLTFNGAQVIVQYYKYPNYGTLEVKIDGNAVATINQNGDQQLGQQWSSSTLSSGTHTLTLTHLSGAYVNLDAVIVTQTSGTPTPTASQSVSSAPASATYDDTDPAITYSPGSNWNLVRSTAAGVINDTLHVSNSVGSIATFSFTGNMATIVYNSFSSRGTIEISVDGKVLGVCNQYASTYFPQKQWSTGELGYGNHQLSIKHTGGANVSLDALIIAKDPNAVAPYTPTPVTSSTTKTIDDTDPLITYNRASDWSLGVFASAGLTNNTQHTTKTIGATATITFTGNQVTIVYTEGTNRGIMDILIDGNKISSLDQRSAFWTSQKKWTSPVLTGGPDHTLTLRNANGGVIHLDALIIALDPNAPTATPTPPPPVLTTFDDTDPNFSYNKTSDWTAITIANAGLFNNTHHLTNISGATASFPFTGEQISLLYTQGTNRGSVDILIDGQKIFTLNQNAATWVPQKKWTTPLLTGSPNHTLTLRSAGGGWVQIDAVVVAKMPDPTPTPTVTHTPTLTATVATLPPIEPTPMEETPTPRPTAQPTPIPTMVSYQGCQFPADNIWNARVDSLPVDSNSSTYIAAVNTQGGLHPEFGAGIIDGQPVGIPYNVVDSNYPKVQIVFDYAGESDPGPYPIPVNVLVEGGLSNESGDRHIIILDKDNCRSYEVYRAYRLANGNWSAFTGAIWELNSNNLRPAGWTSADGAGLPVLPGLVRYDEVASGQINHALRFKLSQARNTYVWPARHSRSLLTDANLPPMGQRFRLKASFDVSPYPASVQVILNALKTYGMILADTGADWSISGAPDNRWDNIALATLGNLRGTDFEAVDVSSLKISEDSAQSR